MYVITVNLKSADFPGQSPQATFYARTIQAAVKWVRTLQRSFKQNVQPSAYLSQVINHPTPLKSFPLGDYKVFVFQPSPIPYAEIPTVIDYGATLESV